LIVETRKPIPAKPGQPVRYDYEYERNGVANIFMTFAHRHNGPSPRLGGLGGRMKFLGRRTRADPVLASLGGPH
jgi:hypothetical protein